MKIRVLPSLLLEPFGRLGLGFFDDVLDGELARQQTQGVNVVRVPADNQRGRIDIVPENRCFVGVELLTNPFVCQPRTTPFCAVHNMDEDSCERL